MHLTIHNIARLFVNKFHLRPIPNIPPGRRCRCGAFGVNMRIRRICNIKSAINPVYHATIPNVVTRSGIHMTRDTVYNILNHACGAATPLRYFEVARKVWSLFCLFAQLRSEHSVIAGTQNNWRWCTFVNFSYRKVIKGWWLFLVPRDGLISPNMKPYEDD